MQTVRKLLQHDFLVFIGIFIFALLLRFPFFFQDVIDWDESTFILMGQSLLDGHLPYTEIWDNKPPLLFAVVAAFIKIFGKTIVGVRLAGSVCVAISAFFLYLILKQGWGIRGAIIASFVSIYTMTVVTSGQSLMSEHIALVPVMSAFYILSRQDFQKTIHYFVVGFLLACATLVRLNLIYLDLIVGLWLLISLLKQKEPFFLILRKGLAYGAGNVFVILATLLPYLSTGEIDIWWRSVILAPLNYSSTEGSIANSILFFLAGDEISAVGFLLTIIGVWYVWQAWQTLSPVQQKIWQIGLLFYGAIAISMIRSGATFEHYFIQVAPFWGGIVILAFQLSPNLKKIQKIFGFLLILILLFSSIKAEFPIKGYFNLASQLVHYRSPWMGSSYPLADYINKYETEQNSIYILGPHLVHWLTETMPLSRCSTHPSNTFRESLLAYCGMKGSESSPVSEIQFIFNKKPQYLLLRDSLHNRFLSIETELGAFFQRELDSNYKLVLNIDQDKFCLLYTSDAADE
ncbi:glycosyltransferase family 39 protein [Synechococcus moorigangaii CMS01]|nr:glycosyltransferase family 39 protein [Synechococcus moorigangaii CMS01]